MPADPHSFTTDGVDPYFAYLAEIEESLKRARVLQAEVEQLIETLHWHLFLGFDPTSVEFVRNLNTQRPNHTTQHS